MTAREAPELFTDDEKAAIVDATRQIFETIRDLPDPRHAANALAQANAELIIQGCGVDSEKEAEPMIREMAEGIRLNVKKKLEHLHAGHA